MRRRAGKFHGLPVLLIPLGACATRGDVEDLRSEVLALSARQDSAIATMRRSVDEQHRAAMDSVLALSEQMFHLRGTASGKQLEIEKELEGVRELAKQNLRTLERLSDDLDARWREVERRIAQAEVGDSAVEGGETGVADYAEPRGITEDEQALFDIAVAAKERDLSTSALRGFNTFIDQYPRSPLVPAAHLHRGELLTLDDKPDEAIASYLEIPRMFPTSDLIPRALYRAGVLCIELEYHDRAREYLERVINTYPDDHFAEQAREKLDEIP